MMLPKHLIQYDKIIDGSIPVIIINYNRCQTLMQMVDWLLNLDDAVSIIIIDNASAYPPLLQYYDTLDLPNVQVKRFTKNHCLNKVIAISQTMQQFDYYVITDADLIPYQNTKGDILTRMKSMLEKYKELYPALRLGKNYSLKHVDRYVDPLNLSEENKFNIKTSTGVSTWNTRLKNAIPGL